MNSFKIGILAVIVGTSIVTSWAIQRRAQIRWRERGGSLREQAEQLTQLSAENERLSNLVAQAKTSRPLSQDQFTELLRLRSEIGPLRQAGTERRQLQATNAQLRARIEKSEKPLAEAQAEPNYWAKDQLKFAGYSSPESSLKSVLWAMSDGNAAVIFDALTPEALAGFLKERARDGRAKADPAEESKAVQAEFRALADALTSAASGFRVLDQRTNSAGEVVLSVSFEGEGATRKFALKQAEGKWRIHRLILAGMGDGPD